jgi:hypothetical protein
MNLFRAIIREGQLDFGSQFNTLRFKEFLAQHEGKPVRIEHEVPVRSRSQNALYWVYLDAIEQETGNNASDLHEYFKRTLLPPRFVTVLGKELKLAASTKDLTKLQFGEYLDKIAALTGVPLPDPAAAGYLPH